MHVDEARRVLILAAAERLFHRYGPQKTTIADIAREARIGVGSVYLEFRSKDAILGALSTVRHDAVLGQVRLELSASGSYAVRLRRGMTARIAAFLRNAEAGSHSSDLFHCRCSAIEEAHRTFREREHSLLADFLLEGSLAGEFAASDVRRTARALLRAYAAFSPPDVFHAFFEVGDGLMDELEAVHDLVLRGLVSR